MAASRKGSCPGKKVCERVREGTGVEGNKRRTILPEVGKLYTNPVGLRE